MPGNHWTIVLPRGEGAREGGREGGGIVSSPEQFCGLATQQALDLYSDQKFSKDGASDDAVPEHFQEIEAKIETKESSNFLRKRSTNKSEIADIWIRMTQHTCPTPIQKRIMGRWANGT